MITGIHHVQITVSPEDEAAARAFYCGVLVLPEIEKPDSLKGRGGFWVQVGDRQMHIGIEEGVQRARTKAHVAFQVTSAAEWRDRLMTAGVDVLESIPIPGFDRFECRDPFGNRMELIQAL